ncbi:MAG: hypothetical protein EAX96_01285 [Candidatus Lokiarchaeota archaeon]|nr:hypothetical protein [Candidatus Lokiarchaeota archaeon]
MVRGKEIDDSFIFDDLWEKKMEKEKISKNLTQIWVTMFQWPIPINGLAVGDLTGDGFLEIAGVSDDHFLRVFNHTGKELWKKDLFDAVIFSKIGNLISKEDNNVLVGGADKLLHVFDKDGNEVWNKKSRKWWYNAKIIDINKDGVNEIIAGSRDRSLYCLNGKTGEEIWLHEFDAYIKYLDAIDNMVAAAADDGIVKIFDEKGTEKFSDELNERVLYCEILKHDNINYLGVASAEGEFKIYNIDDNKIIFEKEIEEIITSFKFTNKIKNQLSVLLGDNNAFLYNMNIKGDKLWEISTEEENYCIELGDIQSRGVEDIIVGGKDSKLRILNSEDGTVRSYYSLDNFTTNIILADIDNDGHLEIVTSGRDRTIRVFREKI